MTANDGAAAISAERQRQIDVEGYNAEHDYRHPVDAFVQTAGAYLGLQCHRSYGWSIKHDEAAMEASLYSRRDLVKAGALIAAAIDRLDRAAEEREGRR